MKKNCEIAEEIRPCQTTGGRQLYHFRNKTGQVQIAEYNVFPGIWLTFKDAYIRSFEYPTNYPENLLEITHCREGRLEYEAGERFFYLGKGALSIHRSEGSRATLHCPTRCYHGLSLIIDLEAAPYCASCLLADVEVKPQVLADKFCPEGGHFIMRSTPQLGHIFSELYSVPSHIRRGYFKVKALELLLFLAGVEPAASQEKRQACTRAQLSLAREVLAYVREHKGEMLTTRQLAAPFQVSEDQLRRCFTG